MYGKFLICLMAFLLCTGCSGKKDDSKGGSRVVDKDEGPPKEKPPAKDKKTTDRDGKPADGTEKPPDTPAVSRITGKTIGSDFRDDVKAATAKYHGKVFELRSLVEEMGLSSLGEAYLSVVGAEEPTQTVIECYVKEKEPWGKVVPGQTVTLKGRCEILSGEMKFRDCQILDVSGPKAIAISADDLVKKYDTDAAAAAKMYDTQWLEVSGEALKVESVEALGKTTFTLKTAGKVTLTCIAEGGMADRAKRLKPGDTVKLIGRQKPYDASSGIDLVSCVLFAKQ